jgi:hypothetical protein
MSIGFFILAEDFASSIQVVIEDLKDTHLAVIIYRLFE